MLDFETIKQPFILWKLNLTLQRNHAELIIQFIRNPELLLIVLWTTDLCSCW